MTSRSSVIQFDQISFSYRNQELFKDFDFEINGNQFVGIIGVNGSGKSTFLKLILGLLAPQKGQVRLLEKPAGDFANKFHLGSSLQDIDFPGAERVEEILKFVGDQYPQSLSIESLIEDFQLQDFRNKACSQLSGGMKRRLSLACAFVGQPTIVLLDEPTTGLDKDSRDRLMSNLKKYQKDHNALVMMISHHPEEVIHYVDQFFHIKDWSVSRVTTEQMKKFTKLRHLSFTYRGNETLPNAIRWTQSDESRYDVLAENSDDYIRSLVAQNITFEDLSVRKLMAEELLEAIL